jgi:hypothetical protein
MRRGLVFFIGVAILGTGIWLIATDHARDMSCKASTNVLQNISATCQAIGWDYFLGFVAAAAGVIVILFCGLIKRHEPRGHLQGDRPTEYSLRMHSSRPPDQPLGAKRRRALFSEDLD